MDDNLLARLEKKLLLYVKKRIIPHIRSVMKSKNYVAAGDYNKQLRAKTGERSGDTISVDLTSTNYSQFVEGTRSGFSAQDYQYNKRGVDSLRRWSIIRGLRFRRKNKDGGFTGKPLSYQQTAYVIIKSWQKKGKEPRFFMSDLLDKHIGHINKEMEQEVLNTKINF